MDESRGKSINVNLKLELQYGERNCFLEGNFQIRTDKENGFIIREDYRQSIRKELQGLGFPSSACGTIYLEEGIFYFIHKQKRKISITKELYPAVAEKYSTNAANVERNIRTTIEKVWTRGNLQRLDDFGSGMIEYKTGRPTNGTVIHTLARKVQESSVQGR